MSNKYPGGFVSLGGQVGYSVNFNGTNQYLQLPVNSAFDLGTNACCIEAWVYISSASEFGLFCTSSGASGQTRPNFVVSTTGLGADYFGNPFLSFSATISLGKWTHVAFTRASTNGAWRGFVNGVMVGYNATGTQNLLQTTVAQNIGRYASTYYTNGNISNLRITNGSVPTLYQTASTTTGTVVFTPPTQLFAETNTVLLTCSQPVVNDQSTNNFTITNFNGATVSGVNTPFTAYNPNLLDPALGASTPGIWTLDQALNAEVTRSWPMYDPYYKNVVLNLHGEGTNGAQNNTFLDSSTNNFTITRNGNTTQGSFSPYGLNWSNYFASASDYLSIADNTALEFGAGDFTVECWINLPSLPTSGGSQNIMSKWATGQKSYIFSVFNNAGTMTLQFDYSTDGSTTATPVAGNVALSAGVWYHVAFVRSGTSFKIFLNGTEVTSGGTVSGTLNGGTAATLIGRTLSATYPYNGYISNLRVTKGGALYTSNFTPSTTPLTTTVSAGTVSLLTCQSNCFVDNSASPLTITIAGGTPSVQRFSPFLFNTSYTPSTIGGSGYFGADGDYLTVSTGVSIGSSESFTAEAWVYPTRAYTGNQQNVFGGGNGTNTQIYHDFGSDGNIGVYLDGGSLASSSGYVKRNAWNHLVWCREGSTLRLFVNGVLATSGTVTNACAITFVGYSGSLSPLGYIAGARVLKGVALYTAAFTPPTTPPTAISGTELLCNFTNAGIVDNAMMNDLETVGNAQISTSVKKYGTGSMYFDGTGDYLQLPVSKNFNFSYGDFTIEGWINVTSVAATFQTIFSTGYTVQIYEYGGTIYSYFNDSDNTTSYIINGLAGPASAIGANTWAHFAVVRSGTTFTCYINGVAGTSLTSSGNVLLSATAPTVGSTIVGTAYPLNGYIDDLRITKGVARYLGNFTPPTSQLQDQ